MNEEILFQYPQPETEAPFAFQLLQDARDGTMARAGRLATPHGPIDTPVFMPVGTQATVKTLTPDELEGVGAQIILSNTYHLYLRPGAELIAQLGGLHRFMQWSHPILTDSGGFQVFSLNDLRRIDETGVAFKSHLDGSRHLFTPESVMNTQHLLGADIIMAFDECPPAEGDRAYIEASLARTHRWAERCRTAHLASGRASVQALFGIVQGGFHADLRQESAKFQAALDLPGYGIGGLSIGESKAIMHSMLEATTPYLPAGKPRYLMGVGSAEDLLEAIDRGVDMFDCVLPTRIARNAAIMTAGGRLNLRNATFARDEAPIEEGCLCYTCQRFSRAYLRHLFKAEEILALRLASIHNLFFLLNLVKRARTAIVEGNFPTFKREFLAGFEIRNEEVRARNREARLASRSKDKI